MGLKEYFAMQDDLAEHVEATGNVHNMTKNDLGLGNVDNTADADKTVKSAGACTGNAATATKLASARKITLAGDASGSVSFDGSADKTLTVAINDDSHNHTIANIDGLQDELDGKAASSHNHSASNITSGTLAVARGGTGVTANPSMLVNLASTTADTVFEASPRPGVTGTLPLSNGGTGATTAAAARTNLGITKDNLAALGLLPTNPGSNYPITTNLYFNSKYGRVMATETYAQIDAINNPDDTTTFNSLILMNKAGVESSGLDELLILHTLEAGSTTGGYRVFGEHNKPSGTYSGNGSATSRTIDTGGVGRFLMIQMSGYFILVTRQGGLLVETENKAISYFSVSELFFKDGILTIATTNSKVNTSGVTYQYYVI